ncbi:MAG: ABC transporter substrate-binding protein [Candidatus Eisenbacteria bacterium]|nr:ABC transporter substrate-binding protein [Candidatus Eisenbacteria bacterium]
MMPRIGGAAARRVARLAVCVLLAFAALGARERPRDAAPLPPDHKVVDAELGRFGGRIVLASRNGPRTFNGITANEVSSTDVTNRLYEQLITYNNELQRAEPGIAKSWERSRDGRTWTMHLRHAFFSDGTPITSADVLFSFDVVYDPRVHPSTAELVKVRGQKFQLSAPDDSTVVFRLADSYGVFLDVIGAVNIMPRARLESAFREGKFESAYGINTRPEDLVTSGPWRLKQFAPGERVVLEPNPYWYESDRRGRRLPYLDEIVWLVVPDQNAELLKFEQGEIDAIDVPRSLDFPRLKAGEAQGRYVVHDLGVSLATVFFGFNLNLKADLRTPCADPVKYRWFSNLNFRRAVAMAADQGKMVRLAYQGQASPNWGPSTRGNKKWYDPDVKQYSHDTERARRLLQREGFEDRNHDGWLEDPEGNKVQFSIITNADNNVRVSLCNLLKSDLRQVGIDLVVTPLDFNQLIGRIRDSKDFEALLLGFAGGVPPDPALGQNVWKSRGKNHFWYSDQPRPMTAWEAECDSLMDELSRVEDQARRKRLWDRVQEIVTDQAVIVYLPSERAYVVARNKFGNLRPALIPHRVLWNSSRIFLK